MKPKPSNPLFAGVIRRKLLAGAIVCSFGASTPQLSAQSISVNFGADRSASAVNEADKLTGAVPVAGNFWNNTTVNGGGSLSNLLDSTGATTTAGVTWTAQNTWQSGSTGATATSENGDLTKGYLDDSGPGWTVQLDSPYLLQDIYVIHATDTLPANISAVRVNGVFYKGNGAGGTIPASGINDSWSAQAWTNADTLAESDHFIKIPNQVAVNLAGFQSSPGRAAIAGVQVVNAFTGSLAYWDTNGATPGAADGFGVADGTWGSDAFWTSSATGETATGAWVPGSAAVFSAGSDASESSAVSVNGTQEVAGIWVQDGDVTLNGGILDLGSGTGVLRDDAFGLVINSQINAVDLSTRGAITLNSASNSITGLVTIDGITTLGANHSFNRLAGLGTLDLQNNSLSIGDATNSSFGGVLTGGASSSLVKTGVGTLTLSGSAASWQGSATVSSGILRFGSATALGQSSGVTVANGAQADLAGSTLGANTQTTWTIAGSGVGGTGAIINTGGAVFTNAGILNLTLTGSAGIGGTGRFDIGRVGANSGIITGNGHTLTKEGTNFISLRGDASGSPINIVANAGRLWAEDTALAFGGTNGTITINNGARVGTFGILNIATPVSINTGGILYNEGGGTGTWSGTINAANGTVIDALGQQIITSGTVTAAGNLQKAGGSQWTITGNATIAGNLDIQTGTVQAGDLGTAGSIGNPGSISINHNGLGLRYRLSGADATLSSPVSFSGADSRLLQHAGTEADKLTLTGAVGTDPALGVIASSGGNLVLGSSANVQVRSLAVGSENGGQTAFLTIQDGATITNRYMDIGNGGGRLATVNQTGGNVTLEAGDAGFRLAHWSGANRQYNLSGGTLDATALAANSGEARWVSIGWDGQGLMTVGGGAGSATLKSAGIRLDRNRPGSENPESSLTILNNGLVEIGSLGIEGQGTNDFIILDGGTASATATSTWAARMDVLSASTINVGTGFTATQSGEVSGSGSFNKTGDGNLLLTNTGNTFNGTAAVSGGALFLSGNAAFNASVVAQSGGTLRAGTPAATGTAFMDSLGLDGGNTTFRVGANLDAINVDTLTVTNPSTISIIPTSALSVGQKFELMAYGGSIGGLGSGGISLNPIANPHYTAALDFSDVGFIDLEIISADTITWTGAVNGNWDVNTTSNWETDSDNLASNFYEFDVVKFDDSGANTNITLIGTINPALVEVDAAQNYSFSGSGISGTTGLSKSGDGTLTLLNDNSYAGSVSITGGSVVVGNGGTTGILGGSGGINVSTGATLTFNRSDAQTLTRSITGGGTLISSGGNFTLNAANNLVDIVVNSGTFFARGGGFSTGYNPNRLITVNTGATLDTVTHSMGSAVGGGGDVPRVTLDGGNWQLNNEQYMRELTMIGGTTTGAGEIRVLSGSTYAANASANSSVIGSRLNVFGNSLSLNVADGAAEHDLVVSGEITNSGTINKSGDGTLLIAGNNTFSGTLAITAGVVQIGNGGTTGAPGTGNIVNNASLVINRSDNLTVSNIISGTGSLTKNGAGILTLDTVHTYTGNTLVNAGTLVLSDTGGLRFTPTTNGTGNRITGTGTVELSGTFTIDLAGANLTNGNSWTLVDVGSLSSAPHLSSFSINGFTEVANVHTLVDGDNTWTYSEATGVLTLAVASGSDYDDWADGFGLVGGPNDDDDNDGLSNFQEYAFGLDPTSGASVTPIAVPLNKAAGTFTYTRRDPDLTGLSYSIQTSTTLAVGGWTTDAGAGQNVVGTVGDVQTVEVTLSGAPLTAPKFFVRVKAED